MTVTWMPQVAGATPPDGVEMRLEHGRVFDLDVAPKGPEFDFDRVEGMLLGVAIGDSLGNTTEPCCHLDVDRGTVRSATTSSLAMLPVRSEYRVTTLNSHSGPWSS